MRPPAVLVLGVLCIVFAAFNYTRGFYGLLVVATGEHPLVSGDARLNEEFEAEDAYLEAHVPGIRGIRLLATGGELLMGTLLLITGYGLLRMRRWGRSVAILYAALSIGRTLFHFGYTQLLVAPAERSFARESGELWSQPGRIPAGAMADLNVAVDVFLLLVTLALPVGVLIVLWRRSVAEAFNDADCLSRAATVA